MGDFAHDAHITSRHADEEEMIPRWVHDGMMVATSGWNVNNPPSIAVRLLS
jgi:hypothetical protein